MQTLSPKKNKKESFADKTTFNSHTFYKMNGFTTTINATTRSLAIFYVNPCSWPNKNGMDKP